MSTAEIRQQLADDRERQLAANPGLREAYEIAGEHMDLVARAAALLAADVPRMLAITALKLRGFGEIISRAALDIAAERRAR